MIRDKILAILRGNASDLRRLGAARPFLFGSASRNESSAASDVDLFLEQAYDQRRRALAQVRVTR